MSWNALGENPVPGEVDAVMRVASTLGGVCDQADLITSRLRVLDGGTGPQIWRGEAATAFRDLLAKIGPDLMKLSTSHHEAQEALRTYARSLGDAQGQARQAEGDAERAVADKSTADSRHQQAADEAASQEAYARAAQMRILQAQAQQLAAPLDPVYQASMQQYQQQVGAQRANAQAGAANARSRAAGEQAAANAAAARLAAAKKLAHQASMLRDDAARTATRLIDAAAAPGIAHHNILERTWNDIKATVRDVTASPEFATWMNVLSDVGDVLSIMATISAFIPVLNVATGPLLLLAASFKGAAFLGTALAALNGHASAGQVAGRAVDFAFTFMGMAKFAKTGGTLAGDIKRSLNYDDARKATGYLRSIKVSDPLGAGRTMSAVKAVGKRFEIVTPENFFRTKTLIDTVRTIPKPVTSTIAIVRDLTQFDDTQQRMEGAPGTLPKLAEKATDEVVDALRPN